MKLKKTNRNIINHATELPRVIINYSDANRSFIVESADYSYNVALGGCLFLLDKRLKVKGQAKYKDNSIG